MQLITTVFRLLLASIINEVTLANQITTWLVLIHRNVLNYRYFDRIYDQYAGTVLPPYDVH